MKTRILFRAGIVIAATTLLPIAVSGPAAAAGKSPLHHGGGGGGGGGNGGSSPTAGIDISYVQCGAALPTGKAFAIVGVNGGLANDYNSCVGSEFRYAQASTGITKQAKAQLYLNTADPGNGVADWPSPNQLGAYGSPITPSGTCGYANGTSGPGADSPACAYIYGYDMVSGITYTNSGGSTATVTGDVAAFNQATGAQLVAYPVWLDVETANSWQTGTAGLSMNVADLQGMVDGLKAAAAGSTATVGVYSTSYQWNQITGTPGSGGGNLAGIPDWIPGASNQSGATSNCSLPSFTSGAVSMTQWFGSPYDGDYSCIG